MSTRKILKNDFFSFFFKLHLTTVYKKPITKGMSINTYFETDLHREIKNIYTKNNDKQEVQIDSFICDIEKEDGSIIEVQTKQLSSLKKKIDVLSKKRKIKVVHPVINTLYLQTNEKKRKSPKKATWASIFNELTQIYSFFSCKNFSLEVISITATEFREEKIPFGKRRKPYSIVNRRLDSINEKKTFTKPKDFLCFLPTDLPKEFTVKDLKATLKKESNIAVWVLKKMGVIKQVGKKGAAYLYSL